MSTLVPNCPKCQGAALAPARLGMSLPYRCTVCAHSFGLVGGAVRINLFSQAERNKVFALSERLSGHLDLEQYRQTLDALNGTRKDE